MAKIGIIGSGVAGLSAAAHLISDGNEVTVFEANNYPGGKLTAFEKGGYRFDAGPSLFTMPHLLDEIFTYADKDPRDYYSFKRVDPGCHYFWEDGTEFKAHSEPKLFAQEAFRVLGANEQKTLKYIKQSGEAYDITEDIFLKSSLHKISTYLKWSTVKSLLQLHKTNLFSTLNDLNEEKLQNKKLVQLFNRYATYNGSNPYQAPGTLAVIPTLEHRWGTFLPRGGMISITNGLFKLSKDLGVKFHFNERVSEIDLKDNLATGLITDKGSYKFDYIVSNMDVLPTYERLISKLKAPKKILEQERSSSALIFYWGVKSINKSLGLHNIFWSDTYREEFESIFQKKEIHSDPTVYLNITSKFEKSDAPEGSENWFVMVNAPNNIGQDWSKIIPEVKARIINKLNRNLGIDLNELIETETVLSPQDIENNTSSYLGALYGTSSNSRMAAFFRHPNFHRKIKNLFFCGGSVHPGGGIPLCLLSGKITSELIK